MTRSWLVTLRISITKVMLYVCNIYFGHPTGVYLIIFFKNMAAINHLIVILMLEDRAR